jgi:hypothetical protein
MKKNKFFFAGMLALLLTFGLVFVGCEDSEDDDDDSSSGTRLDGTEWHSAGSPYHIFKFSGGSKWEDALSSDPDDDTNFGYGTYELSAPSNITLKLGPTTFYTGSIDEDAEPVPTMTVYIYTDTQLQSPIVFTLYVE